MNDSARALWQAYLRTCGETLEASARTCTAWHFCNNERDADELAALVVQGRKRATASCGWVYELEGQPLPKVGDCSVITDWQGQAQCIIRTTRIDVVPFEEVSAEFARAEGEGDLSLEYWRKGHWHFFDLELRTLGRQADPRMPVLCEHFEVIFGAPETGA